MLERGRCWFWFRSNQCEGMDRCLCIFQAHVLLGLWSVIVPFPVSQWNNPHCKKREPPPPWRKAGEESKGKWALSLITFQSSSLVQFVWLFGSKLNWLAVFLSVFVINNSDASRWEWLSWIFNAEETLAQAICINTNKSRGEYNVLHTLTIDTSD